MGERDSSKKARPAVGKLPLHVQLEVPRFGEFARQHTSIRSSEIMECLVLQRERGGRIGTLMAEQGLLSPTQVREVLRSQARWAAQMRSHDIAPLSFPLFHAPVSLCLPCYNEAEVIGEVLSGACAVLPEFLDEFEIVVVDDGSTDATVSVIERISEHDDRIRLIRHRSNRGYGAAVATALREARGEWICFTDGDGQFNLLDLPQLLVAMQHSDVVIGYRGDRADNVYRKTCAYCWGWLIRSLMGLQVRDLDCAFKIFPRRVVEKLQLTAEGNCISAEILAQCARGGVSVCELPVNHFPRSTGKAKGVNLGVVVKAFRELPIVWRYRRMRPWCFDRQCLKSSHEAHAAIHTRTQDKRIVVPPAHSGTTRPVKAHAEAEATRMGTS